jgi:hypothetical protein
MKPRLIASFAALLAALAFGQTAKASSVAGTLGFTPIGSTMYAGSTLGSATSVTLPSLNVVNNLPDTAGNDFASGPVGSTLALGDAVHFSSLTIDTSAPHNEAIAVSGPSISFSSGTSPLDRYVFTPTLEMITSDSANSLTISYTGYIVDTGGLYDSNTSSVQFGFTTVSNGAANYSATLAAPAAFSLIPEPSSFVLASIAGIVGLGVAARRRTVKS